SLMDQPTVPESFRNIPHEHDSVLRGTFRPPHLPALPDRSARREEQQNQRKPAEDHDLGLTPPDAPLLRRSRSMMRCNAGTFGRFASDSMKNAVSKGTRNSTAEFTPIRRPRASTTGPPLSPGSKGMSCLNRPYPPGGNPVTN